MNILCYLFEGLKTTVWGPPHEIPPSYNLLAVKLNLIQNAMSATNSCPKEIAQMIFDYSRYAPNRTRDNECCALIASISYSPPHNDLVCNHKKMELLACMAETQEVVIDGNSLACPDSSPGNWKRVADAIKDIPVVSSLTIYASNRPIFYSMNIIEKEAPRENGFGFECIGDKERKYRKGHHSIIQFLEALTHQDLEHFEINLTMLYPTNEDDKHLDESFAQGVCSGIKNALFDRASLLTSMTVCCEHTPRLPLLQFPKTLKKITLKNCTASEKEYMAWKQQYAPTQEVVCTIPHHQ